MVRRATHGHSWSGSVDGDEWIGVVADRVQAWGGHGWIGSTDGHDWNNSTTGHDWIG